MAGMPKRRARREGQEPEAPNPGMPRPAVFRESPDSLLARVRVRASNLPTDPQLLAFAKAVLWDVAECAWDPRDRANAAKSLVDATTPKAAKADTDGDGLDKLPADQLMAEVDRAKRALGDGEGSTQ